MVLQQPPAVPTTIVSMDGFDHYADPAQKGYLIVGAATNVINGGRNGLGALHVTGNGVNYIRRTLSSSVTAWRVGLAIKWSGHSGQPLRVFSIENGSGTVLAGLEILTDGRLRMGGAESSVALTSGTYGHAGIKIDGSTVEVYMNGRMPADLALMGSVGGVTSQYFRIGNDQSGANGYDLFFDDFYAGEGDDLLGDLPVNTLYPVSSGKYSDWAISPALISYAWAATDDSWIDTTNAEADYIWANVVDSVTSVHMTDPLLATAPPERVFGVQASTLARKEDANPRSIHQFAVAPDGEVQLSSITMLQTYLYTPQMVPYPGATTRDWTPARLGDAELGVHMEA